MKFAFVSLPGRVLILVTAFLMCATVAAHAVDTPSTPATPSGLKAARVKVDAGDYRGAIPMLTAYLQDHPRDADALNLMGFSLRKTGNPTQALDYYNRALALAPQHLGANEYLGELYVELGQLDKAKERLAVLRAACGNCEEYRDLAAAIAKGEKRS
jgi:tetratricopeptide (TPR) repeat protein